MSDETTPYEPRTPEEEERFRREWEEHAERVSKIIASWPEWKRNLLGGYRVEKPEA